MAGAGVRLFTAGSILTAQQVNEYLQDQVVARFADAAARDAAFGGLGEPVLSEGRLCYLDSDNNVYIYNGSAWVELQSGIPGTAGQVVVYDSGGEPLAQTVTGDVTISSSAVTSISADAIVNADINAGAAIALSKLASGTAGQLVVHNSSGVPTATSVTGDVTITSSGVTAIGSGVIVNADINASAAIAHSKLANITAGSVLLGNSSNIPTATALSGDVTVNSSGVTAIGSGVIVNADINASAAIALSKLATSTSSQLAGIISDETGTGALVFANTPTLTTPNIGAATGTSLSTTGGTVSVRAASTQDGVVIQGRAGGSTTRAVTITPTTLSANRTITLPDADGTVVTSADLATGVAAFLGSPSSVNLRNAVTDETGSGALVFGTSPTITPAEGTTTNAHNGAGYMGMPQTAPATSMPYTLLASDAGKHIYVTTTGTVTIPANGTTAFPIGTTIVIVSANGVTTTVSITTDTLRLANSTSTGNRTIASNGMATLLKLTSTLWIISGNGVT